MIRTLSVAAVTAGLFAASTVAVAQPSTTITQLAGTRLDLSVTGEVSRTPDIALISAGVTTQAVTATDALAQNSTRMERVRAALKRSGIADRDIQTASVNLAPQYRYVDQQQPQLTGYQASNLLSIRFRDVRGTGRIIDVLVAQGANQINGPTLSVDKPEPALDEARTKAVATGRARAELYARSLGMRVTRVLSVMESGGYIAPPPMPMSGLARSEMAAKTSIDPGEQQLQITVTMSFELQ